jgi:radical SAM-linked protein
LTPHNRRIDPTKDLRSILASVEKPARYVGGEYGVVQKPDAPFRCAIAFPDLYEIGMCNQAVKILYNGLNRLEGVGCERVFAPAPDFETALKAGGWPLYTLESGIPLSSLDLIGFSLGYELGITGVLSILDCGGIPIEARARGEDAPIVVMGGPASSNPAPFGRFVDAVWIGEAEAGFFPLIAELAELKARGEGRASLIAQLGRHESIWMPGKSAERAIMAEFSTTMSVENLLPIANMKTVHDHGVVEIMRGCPNGCRFCHAGTWYKPMRQKSADLVAAEVAARIDIGGYTEISLSSLSSGDYASIRPLVESLNRRYGARRISFQLPSLKVSSFGLELLDLLAETRKSGLTFAVETPTEAGQLSINKEVSFDEILEILRLARQRGWKHAKFYFMLGLPNAEKGPLSEEEAVIDFFRRLRTRTSMEININVNTFVPKPHTPFQTSAQLDEESAQRKIDYIRNGLKPLNVKVRSNDVFLSVLEGVIARGDEDVGELIRKAFDAGCRLDAWDEFVKKDVWRSLLTENFLASRLSERSGALPWASIRSRVSTVFLRSEKDLADSGKLTGPCIDDCDHNCGVCGSKYGLSGNHCDEPGSLDIPIPVLPKAYPAGSTRRMAFTYSKLGPGAYLPHLGLIEVFSKAFVRTGFSVQFTLGFNPIIRMDFAAPLAIGFEAEAEVCTVDIDLSEEQRKSFVERMNDCLPSSIRIRDAVYFSIALGQKKLSAAAVYWGAEYSVAPSGETVRVPSAEEKEFRSNRIDGILVRRRVLAKGSDGAPSDYLGFFRNLYP